MEKINLHWRYWSFSNKFSRVQSKIKSLPDMQYLSPFRICGDLKFTGCASVIWYNIGHICQSVKLITTLYYYYIVLGETFKPFVLLCNKGFDQSIKSQHILLTPHKDISNLLVLLISWSVCKDLLERLHDLHLFSCE